MYNQIYLLHHYQKQTNMSSSWFTLSVIASIWSKYHLKSDQKVTTDARFYTYCWNYSHTELGDYNVVEVEDLTVPIQLDDASLFLDSVETTSDIYSNIQMVY